MNLVHDFTLGKIGETLYTFIEIPKGSMHKIEYDIDLAVFKLDRVEPEIFAKPVNYGFIPQTLDEDGDPLDTLVITSEPLPTGVFVKTKVIGILNFVDGGENDHKVICVPEDDRNDGNNLNDISDLPGAWKAKLGHHFTHYKDLKKPGTTEVQGWGNKDEAWKIVSDCSVRYTQKFSSK